MHRRHQAHEQQTHTVEVRQTYERVLAGASVPRRHVEVRPGAGVHLPETGAGPPVMLLHWDNSFGGHVFTVAEPARRDPRAGPRPARARTRPD
jgi:hypothetical protein